jgi:hypothetical protein
MPKKKSDDEKPSPKAAKGTPKAGRSSETQSGRVVDPREEARISAALVNPPLAHRAEIVEQRSPKAHQITAAPSYPKVQAVTEHKMTAEEIKEFRARSEAHYADIEASKPKTPTGKAAVEVKKLQEWLEKLPETLAKTTKGAKEPEKNYDTNIEWFAGDVNDKAKAIAKIVSGDKALEASVRTDLQMIITLSAALEKDTDIKQVQELTAPINSLANKLGVAPINEPKFGAAKPSIKD